MHSYRTPHIFPPPANLHARLRIFQIRTNGNHPTNAGFCRAIQYDIELAGEPLVG